MSPQALGWVPARANEAGDTDLLGARSLPLPLQCRPDHRRSRGIAEESASSAKCQGALGSQPTPASFCLLLTGNR